MSQPNYSLTVRATIPARVGMLGRVMAAIGDAGGQVGGVDIVRSGKESVTRDIAVYARDEAHGAEVTRAVGGRRGRRASSRASTGSSWRTPAARSACRTACRWPPATTSRWPTRPGVARVCMAIHHDFEQAWEYTIKGNSVMVVSDGSSVVGQGDLGPEASLPALEAKAALLRRLAGIDAFPLPVDLRDPAEIAEAVVLCSSVFAGIHLSDIAAPRCFEVQRLIQERLDIPVFHEDQQGTAAAVLAALTNGLGVAGTPLSEATVVVAGLGPGGQAVVRLLVAAGAGTVDRVRQQGRRRTRAGATSTTRASPGSRRTRTPTGRSGTVAEVLAGAHAFVGLSAPGLLSADAVRAHGARPRRARAGDARPRAAARGGRRRRPRLRHRPPGRAEPDQLGPRVAGHLARRARLPRDRDQRGDDPRRRRGDRRDRRGGRRASPRSTWCRRSSASAWCRTSPPPCAPPPRRPASPASPRGPRR